MADIELERGVYKLRLSKRSEQRAAEALHLLFTVEQHRRLGCLRVYVLTYYGKAAAEQDLCRIRSWIRDEAERKRSERAKIRRERARNRARENKRRMELG